MSDHEVVEVAAAYVHVISEEENGQHPIARVAARLHLSEDTVRRRLGRARSRGFLTPAPRGRAGGRLTAAAEAILRERR